MFSIFVWYGGSAAPLYRVMTQKKTQKSKFLLTKSTFGLAVQIFFCIQVEKSAVERVLTNTDFPWNEFYLKIGFWPHWTDFGTDMTQKNTKSKFLLTKFTLRLVSLK